MKFITIYVFFFLRFTVQALFDPHYITVEWHSNGDFRNENGKAYVDRGLVGTHANGQWKKGPMGDPFDFSADFWQRQKTIFEKTKRVLHPVLTIMEKEESAVEISTFVFSEGKYIDQAEIIVTVDGKDIFIWSYHRIYATNNSWTVFDLPKDIILAVQKSLGRRMSTKDILALLQKTPEEISMLSKVIRRYYSKPKITVSVTQEDGEYTTLMCNISGFFPVELDKAFKKHDRYIMDYMSTDFYSNEEGLWNVDIWLEIPREDKCLYRCSVEHYTHVDYPDDEISKRLPECTE